MRAVNQIILQAMLGCRLPGRMSRIVTQMEKLSGYHGAQSGMILYTVRVNWL